MKYLVQIRTVATTDGWQTISEPFDTREEAAEWMQRLCVESKIDERRK
ncbi:hypothetical protein QFW96_14580 [Saccharopolyspora sp. TS4A08]|uniref:SPOR domain-containing protein n=1 Tax=Saccharopolyspora ipomoeae TaxID=3042027 RepID=A0ABT6PPA8_9PSEU|nr:hypothetical protein [Saccharopolyspora sp. TS4A08]MDI2029854.1 hypothetical protein [Saccharopolyspora sp. TS4A08]